MEKLSPRIDIVFKKLFGVEENKDLLISLINSIVSKEDQVADIILLNPYNVQNFKQDKLSILDIKAKGLDGKRFNIEIQISDEADYDKRALYYWAKLYSEQLKTGQDYAFLAKAIGIHILNFTSIPQARNYHNVFHITEKENGFAYFKDLELHTIELNKFISMSSNVELSEVVGKVQNALDRWVTFLTRHDLFKAKPLPKELDDEKLRKALEVLDVMNFNEEERELYEDHLKWLRIESNTLKKAEDKGEERGIEKGRKEGRKEEKIAMAKKMLAKGKQIDEIIELTELTKEEIEVEIEKF